jgi:hypothetical protein
MKARKVLAGGLLLVIFGVCAQAQTLSLGFAGGVLFPRGAIYRDVYGKSLPLDVEVRLGLFRRVGLATGLTCVGDSGKAINVRRGPDTYAVKLRRVSFPLSVCVLFPAGDFMVFIGGGASFHSFKEDWRTVAISHSGNKVGPLAYAGMEYRLLSRVAARLALKYEGINGGRNRFLADEVALGGLTVSAGVSVRVF